MRFISILFALLAAVIAGSVVPAEQAIIIDFNSLARGEIVSDQFKTQGIRIAASNGSSGPDHAVVFDTTNIGASDDTDLQAPLDAAAGFETLGELSPGNVLVLHERNDCTATFCAEPDDEASRPAGWIEFRFALPVTLHGMKIIDINYEADETPAQLVLYAVDNSILDMLDIPGVDGQGNWRPWAIERSGVARARLHLPGDAAIDDIAFTPSQAINWAPEFRGKPPVAVDPAATWRYTPELDDADDDVVTLQLVTAPVGMVISSGGEISWSPSGSSGEFPVEIMATDSRGASVSQSFVIHADDEFLRTQDFEFATGTIVDDELLADGLSINAFNASSGPDFVISFDTDAPTGGDDDLAAPFKPGSDNHLGLGPRNPGQVLILHENHDCDVFDQACENPDSEASSPAGWIDFTFVQPAHVWSIDVFDVTSDDPAARKVELFDVNDQPIVANLVLPRTGSNDWDRLLIDAVGVMRMRINLDGESALDNLRYALIGSAEPDNQAPVINDEEFHIQRNETLSISAPGVLANDHDPDGDPIVAILDEAPSFGSVVLNADGSFVYQPNDNFTGKDEFEYTVSDGEAASEPEDVEIHVAAPATSAIIQNFGITPDTIASGQGATLSWVVDQADSVYISPAVGSVAASGSILVSPTASVTYTLTATGTDGAAVTASATLTVEPPPSVGPTIVFDYPADGQPVQFPRPPLGIHILDYDAGITLLNHDLRIDGMPLAADCSLRINDRIVCRPDTPISEGTHTITMQIFDIEGDISNLAQVTYYTDLTPPNSPDATKLAITAPNAQGDVTVTGAAGAVDIGDNVRLTTAGRIENLATSADGSFAGLIRQVSGGIVQVYAIDMAGNQSVPVDLVVPSPAPVIDITQPAVNSATNNNLPEFVVSYLQTGAGIDHATLAITANGAPLPVNCTHAAGASHCTPAAALPDGQQTITTTVADANGVQSNIASTTFTIDTVPPPPVVRDKVTLVQEPAGTVTVTGADGAAEAGTTLEITNGTQTVNAVVDTVGAFTGVINGNTGDTVSMVVMDAAGNSSAVEAFEVLRPPIPVTIISPTNAEYVSANRVTVQGFHNGPAMTGVSVNGIRAMVFSDGTFLAQNVPLVAGQNVIIARAAAFDGETGETSVQIDSGAAASPISMKASVLEGPAPLRVKFEVEYIGDRENFHHLEIDIDGDGVAEAVTAQPLLEYEHEFTTAGLQQPEAALATYTGWHYASTNINVLSFQQMDAMFRDLWDGWRTELVAGNTEAALVYISPAKRERYRGMFDGLSGRWPQIFNSFTGMEPGIMSAGFTEYAVNRTINGENRLFLVYFAQDENGIWRLHSF